MCLVAQGLGQILLSAAPKASLLVVVSWVCRAVWHCHGKEMASLQAMLRVPHSNTKPHRIPRGQGRAIPAAPGQLGKCQFVLPLGPDASCEPLKAEMQKHFEAAETRALLLGWDRTLLPHTLRLQGKEAALARSVPRPAAGSSAPTSRSSFACPADKQLSLQGKIHTPRSQIRAE